MTEASTQQPKTRTGASPGTQLRLAREAAGLSHAAISEALHLTVHYIKSLENDEYHKLPGLIFVKGYIRAYARYLKLDVDALIDDYDHFLTTIPAIKSHTLAGNYTRKRNDAAIGWAIAATLVVLIGIGAGWWFFGRSEDSASQTTVTTTTVTRPVAPPVAPPATESTEAVQSVEADAATAAEAGVQPEVPATDTGTQSAPPADQGTTATPGPGAAAQTVTTQPVAAAATPAPAQSATVVAATNAGRQINVGKEGSDQFQLVFAGNSWVEINDGRSAKLYAEMLRSGDTLSVKGHAPFQVLLGDARHVKVSYNGAAVDIAGNVRSGSTARLTLGATVTAPLADAATGVTR